MSGFKTAFCHLVALATSKRYCPLGSSMRMSSFEMGPGDCLYLDDNSVSFMSEISVCPVRTSSNTYLLQASNHEFPTKNHNEPSATSLCIDDSKSLISYASFRRVLGIHSGKSSILMVDTLVLIGTDFSSSTYFCGISASFSSACVEKLI